jgi:hypothetical protein
VKEGGPRVLTPTGRLVWMTRIANQAPSLGPFLISYLLRDLAIFPTYMAVDIFKFQSIDSSLSSSSLPDIPIPIPGHAIHHHIPRSILLFTLPRNHSIPLHPLILSDHDDEGGEEEEAEEVGWHREAIGFDPFLKDSSSEMMVGTKGKVTSQEKYLTGRGCRLACDVSGFVVGNSMDH